MDKEEAMISFFRTFLCILFFLMGCLQANPIMLFYMYELLPDHDDRYNWKIEMYNHLGEDLTNWFITSRTDTAIIRNDLNWTNLFIVITMDSLEDSLGIDPQGDIVQLHNDDGWIADQICFGKGSHTDVSSPLPGQSISLITFTDWDHSQVYYYCLDNTPTLGSGNDGAKGEVYGYLTDQFDDPVADITVQYDYNSFHGSIYTESDTNGYYSFNLVARRQNITFKKYGFNERDTSLQIWPDSSINLSLVFSDTLASIELSRNKPELSFYLDTNYPNPFNVRTTFGFFLPLSDFVDLAVFDVTGRPIETVFSGYLNSGKHTFTWDANSLASGIYFYRLETSTGFQTKKCILMK